MCVCWWGACLCVHVYVQGCACRIYSGYLRLIWCFLLLLSVLYCELASLAEPGPCHLGQTSGWVAPDSPSTSPLHLGCRVDGLTWFFTWVPAEPSLQPRFL